MEKFWSLMKGHGSPRGRVRAHAGSLQKLGSQRWWLWPASGSVQLLHQGQESLSSGFQASGNLQGLRLNGAVAEQWPEITLHLGFLPLWGPLSSPSSGALWLELG